MLELFKLSYQIPAESFQTMTLHLLAFQGVLLNHGPLAKESLGTETQGVGGEQSNTAESAL